MKSQHGFTLIELMVVLVIIAIMAVIAIPRYEQFLIRNAESEAQATMKKLQIELETWRASALTYKGFQPKKLTQDGKVTYGYDDGNAINIPNTEHPNYRIEITDLTGNSLVSESLANTNQTGWVIIATPITHQWKDNQISKFIINSKGLHCKTKTDKDSITSKLTTCDGLETW